jgi:EpsI family protein
MSLLLLISFFIPDEFNTAKPDDGKLLNDQIPKIIGNWHSADFKFENNYYEILGTNDILMRDYKQNFSGKVNNTVYLFITRSKQNRRFAHPPHACLEGEGYNLVNEDSINLSFDKEIMPCNRALFSRNNSGLLVYYWFNSNNRNYNNLVSLYFSFLFMENRRSGGSMVRLSCVVDPNDPVSCEKLLQQFAEEAVPEIIKSL